MNQQTKTFIDKYRIVIILAVLVLFIGALALLTSGREPQKSKYEFALEKQETLTIEAAKAGLDLYYVKNGKYPGDFEGLIEAMAPDNEGLKDTQKIEDFKYSHRGDYQAYKITYTDIDGDMKTIEGNYQQDYQD